MRDVRYRVTAESAQGGGKLVLTNNVFVALREGEESYDTHATAGGAFVALGRWLYRWRDMVQDMNALVATITIEATGGWEPVYFPTLADDPPSDHAYRVPDATHDEE